MSENYSAEDFAQATLATRGKYNYARRIASDGPEPWRDGGRVWRSDAQMAAKGWTPVVESRITEHTLRDSQEKAARKREKLVDHIADQDRVIRRRNDEIAALRERVRVAESGRLSLARLEVAWEAAEVPTAGNPAREGDVVIVRNDSGIGGYFVRPSHETHDFELEAEGNLRVLSRAPREPWQDLADVMLEDRLVFKEDAEGIAKRLCERGFRVAGGDES